VAFRVTNISGVPRAIDALGQRIEPAETVDLNESYTFDEIVASALDEINLRINNDEIRINDGSSDLSKTDSLAFVENVRQQTQTVVEARVDTLELTTDPIHVQVFT